MRRNHSRCFRGFMIASLAAGLGACVTDDPSLDPAEDSSEAVSAITLAEGFETATKAAYAADDVALGTGDWNFDDALIGTSSSDVRTGGKSARLRRSGRITMLFDRTTGAGTVTLHHASFGSDASGTWGLFSSRDG